MVVVVNSWSGLFFFIKKVYLRENYNFVHFYFWLILINFPFKYCIAPPISNLFNMLNNNFYSTISLNSWFDLIFLVILAQMHTGFVIFNAQIHPYGDNETLTEIRDKLHVISK